MRKFALLVIFGLLLSAAACTTVPPVGEMPDSIASAKTADDHRKIAEYFAGKATSYDAEAAWHGKMAASYAAHPKTDLASLRSHCNALREQFLNAAREARALEQAHRHQAEMLGR